MNPDGSAYSPPRLAPSMMRGKPPPHTESLADGPDDQLLDSFDDGEVGNPAGAEPGFTWHAGRYHPKALITRTSRS